MVSTMGEITCRAFFGEEQEKKSWHPCPHDSHEPTHTWDSIIKKQVNRQKLFMGVRKILKQRGWIYPFVTVFYFWYTDK